MTKPMKPATAWMTATLIACVACSAPPGDALDETTSTVEAAQTAPSPTIRPDTSPAPTMRPSRPVPLRPLASWLPAPAATIGR